MTFEPSDLVVAGTGHVYVGDVGATFPTSISDPVDTGDFADLGLTTPEGVHPLFDRQTKDLFGWQVREALRTIITSVPKKFDFTLMQWNNATWALAHGGGAWEEGDPGEFEYTPPDAGFVDERSGIIEFEDGDKHYRFCIAKWLNKAPLDTMLRADDSANFPLSMSVLAADAGGRTWFGQTDDESLGSITGS